jgi:hypothetical protein
MLKWPIEEDVALDIIHECGGTGLALCSVGRGIGGIR